MINTKYFSIFILIFGFLLNPVYSQKYNWERVAYEKINPRYYKAEGKLKLFNGDETQVADLIIDFDERLIYYSNEKTNLSFSLREGDFSRVSLSKFKEGDYIPNDSFFGTFAAEVGASLRKEIYSKTSLNEIKITSVEKEGFFNRSSPKYYVTESGLLDVSNKADITCKVLTISPFEIEYIDSDGDLWSRATSKLKAVKTSGESFFSEREKEKEARKLARILNLFYKGKRFVSINELYNSMYLEYEANFYSAIEDFKSTYVGENILEIIKGWGPFSDKQQISPNRTQYVWSFQKSYTESQSKSSSTSTGSSNQNIDSYNNVRAYINSELGISNNANIYSGGLGLVINSYGRLSSNSFLNYYSSNLTYYRSMHFNKTINFYAGTSVTTDETSKLGLIVDENNNVVEVITKNYFPEPEYGVIISFIDDF